jgi:hypothetical protein
MRHGAHRHVRFGAGCSALWPCRHRCISTELHLALENGACSPRIHHQEHEIGSLAADLQTNAAAFQSHHGGCAPRSGVVFTSAASHGAAAVAAAHNKGGLQNRGIDVRSQAIPVSAIGLRQRNSVVLSERAMDRLNFERVRVRGSVRCIFPVRGDKIPSIESRRFFAGVAEGWQRTFLSFDGRPVDGSGTPSPKLGAHVE